MLLTAPPFPLTGTPAKQFEKFNRDWEKLQQQRQTHQAEIDRITEIDPAVIKATDLDARRAARAELVKVIQSEMQLLQRLRDEWPPTLKAEHVKARTESDTAVSSAEKEITSRLLDMGFPAESDENATGLFIRPDRYALLHPAVREARATAETVSNYTLPPSHATGSIIDKRGDEIRALTAHL